MEVKALGDKIQGVVPEQNILSHRGQAKALESKCRSCESKNDVWV